MADGQAGQSVPGNWKLIASGSFVLANATGPVTLASYVPVAGEKLMAVVSPRGTGAAYVHNDNTNQNPGTNDTHWDLHETGSGVNLEVHSGSSGGCTLDWALFSIKP